MTNERSLKVFVLLIALTVTGGVGTAHAQLGVAGGLNFESLGDIQAGSAKGTFENATGYHVGVFFDLNAAPVAVRPGIFIRDVGEVAFRFNETSEKVNLSFIEVPVDVRVPLLAAPLVKPYLLAGPVLSFPRSSDKEFDDSLEDISVSATVGAGVQVTIPAVGLRLFPELRYAFGISGFLKDTIEVGGVSVGAEDSVTASAFMIRLGVGL